MAARPFWKGYMKLSLVTCPVAMMAATSEEEKVRFHVLNRRTGNRILSQYVDAGTGKPVDEANEVKGYARGDDDYVLLEDEELESVALESARTIDIQSFVAAESIEWIWYDTPYYLTPDDPIGEEAYCVIRDAMRSTAMVGVSRLVLNRRERAIILKPRDNGIVLWTLRFGDEVRDGSEYFASIRGVKPDAELMRLIADLIKSRKKAWSPEMVSDPVQERLLEIVDAKKKGAKKAKAKAKPTAEPEPASNVINIMDALRRSVATAKKPKGR
jgi:DNA end-binding protein Ku